MARPYMTMRPTAVQQPGQSLQQLAQNSQDAASDCQLPYPPTPLSRLEPAEKAKDALHPISQHVLARVAHFELLHTKPPKQGPPDAPRVSTMTLPLHACDGAWPLDHSRVFSFGWSLFPQHRCGQDSTHQGKLHGKPAISPQSKSIGINFLVCFF